MKAHRLHSTLGLRVIINKKKKDLVVAGLVEGGAEEDVVAQ